MWSSPPPPRGFTDAVIANLGRAPGQAFTRERTIPAVAPEPRARWSYARADRAVATETIGVDVYIETDDAPEAHR